LLNPSLLIEVISETSGDYDRGEKFQKYRSLESFREYMLIDSRRYAVECWYKRVVRIDYQ
jgi:Uma2 family endonuclease